MSHLFLVGLSGSGKSTVGPLLAARLGYGFVDMDACIAERAGKPVAQIFQDEGEAGFRLLETALLDELARRPEPLVVATGGGALVSAANRALVRQAGALRIWLRVTPETAAERCRRDAATAKLRPLLPAEDSEAGLAELLRRRHGAYGEAEIQVDTGGLSPDEVVESIVGALAGGKA